jgi:hypothetical protein
MAQRDVALTQLESSTYLNSKVIDSQTAQQKAALDALPSITSKFQHLGIGENYNNELIAAFGAATGQSNVAVSGINSTSAVVNTDISKPSFISQIGSAASGLLATLLV